MIAAVAAALILGAAAPGGSPGPDLDLTDRGPSSTRSLSPGDEISWPIGVSVAPIELAALRIEVRGEGSSRLEDVLLVSLQGCAERWQPDGCVTGSFTIAPPSTVTQWRNRWAAVVRPDGSIPTDVEVLAVVGLADDATAAVQGDSTTVRIGFSATGLVCDSAAADCSPTASLSPTEPVRAGLPRTGVDLAASLLWGIGAVLLGIGTARWGSTRREIHR